MMVSDPNQQVGGRFQYFLGTKKEIQEIKDNNQSIPEDRIISPEFPGPGYIIVMQGNMVVHRGAKLEQPFDRVTMVNGYVPLNLDSVDPSRFLILKLLILINCCFPSGRVTKHGYQKENLIELLKNFLLQMTGS